MVRNEIANVYGKIKIVDSFPDVKYRVVDFIFNCLNIWENRKRIVALL
jgi:hypothetical protein